MTGRVCAAKCQGYICTIEKYWDLIVNEAIIGSEAIDAFIKMNEKNEENVRKFGEKYVHPAGED